MSTSEPRVRASAPDLETEALVGTVIDGRYRLDAIIGRGGMGVVFRGEHVSIRRPVAVKVLHTSLAGVPELRGRFEREAWAIGRIDHPNCVSIFDFGAMPDGSLYLATELLEGESLSELLSREEYLSPTRALRILRQVLAGLEHVHAAGIVHRDVKPENIMIVRHDGDREFAKILDFGIAKMIGAEQEESVKLTQAGMAFGTPVYMAPEQAIGNPIDGRADLYAVSVVAFELITGHPPFYSDDKISLLSMHTGREPPTISERLPLGAAKVPQAVEALVRLGLAKRPHDRIQSAGEFIQRIDQVLAEGDPLTALETRPLTRELTGSQPLVPAFRDEASFQSDRFAPVSPTLGDARVPAPSAPIEFSYGPPQRKLWPYLFIALLASVVGVGIAVVTTRGDAPVELPRGSAAQAAADRLRQGDPEGAIRLLEEVKTQIQTDPLAQLQLGHAYAAIRQNDKALVAYDLALVLSPSLEQDADLRAALTAMTTVTGKSRADPAQIGKALLFLATRTKLEDAKQRVLAAAQDQNSLLRSAALPVVEQLGMGDQVDWLRVGSLDLDQGKTCEERRTTVARLRATGDSRAIEVLQKAIDRKERRKPVNACLIEDAKSAIVFLRERAPGTKARE